MYGPNASNYSSPMVWDMSLTSRQRLPSCFLEPVPRVECQISGTTEQVVNLVF